MKSILILSLLALLTVASPVVPAQTPNTIYKGVRLELATYGLPKLEDLEEGCTYALLTGGFGGEFIEFIRFTSWERIVVTTSSGTRSDRYLVRRYDHKSGTLFNSPEVASLQAACDAALDKKLTQQEPPETGDDEMILVVARKKDGKLIIHTRTFFDSELLEPEFRKLMIQLYGIKKKLNAPAVNQPAAPSQVAPQQAPVPLAPDAQPKQMTPPSSP